VQTHEAISLFQVSWCKGLDNTGSLAESCSEDSIGILEHSVLQTDDNELTAFEASFDESANVLCVRQIKSSIHLIEDIHGCRLELKKGHNERKRNERSALFVSF
jgi:hypothetical protein